MENGYKILVSQFSFNFAVFLGTFNSKLKFPVLWPEVPILGHPRSTMICSFFMCWLKVVGRKPEYISFKSMGRECMGSMAPNFTGRAAAIDRGKRAARGGDTAYRHACLLQIHFGSRNQDIFKM